MGDNLYKVETLSPRQREILRHIAKHMQAKEVAQLLKISERTVKTHTDAARKRLGVTSSREAARMVVEYESRMLEHAGSDTIGLEGRWSSRPIDSPPEALSGSGHDRNLHPETTVFSSPLERAGIRLADVGGPVEAGPHRGNPERRAATEPQRELGEGNLLGDRRDRMADRRRVEFERQLRDLNAPQWLGLIVLVAIISALLMGGLVTAATGPLEAINRLNLHTG